MSYIIIGRINATFIYTGYMSYYQHHISSPIGDIIAIANNEFLLLLEFSDSKELTNKIYKIERKYKTKIIE